jgi:hypothetical protein
VRRAAVCAVAVVALQVASAPAAASPHPPKWLTKARHQLPHLIVKRAASMHGYGRDRFGPDWPDVDDNGCRTRDDILRRDLRRIVFTTVRSCTGAVLTGVLHDPYTGKTIDFEREKWRMVQIDHVVALADAWRTGAKRWTPELRLAYANDPAVLLAVDGPTNQGKGDKDAAHWLPRAEYRCRYVARQIAIKAKYRLWLTRSERGAMVALLRTC